MPYRCLFLGIFFSLTFLLAPAGAQTKFEIRTFDFESLLPAVPMDVQTKQELDEIKAWGKLATDADKARAEREDRSTTMSVFYSSVLGFDPEKLPHTRQLLMEVGRDTSTLTANAKRFYHRHRPPTAGFDDDRSYPSGHSSLGMAWGLALAEVLPEKRDALLARGLQIGDDRLVLEVHYPSDVVAGRILAAAVVKQLNGDPDFQRQVAQAADEIRAFTGGKN